MVFWLTKTPRVPTRYMYWFPCADIQSHLWIVSLHLFWAFYTWFMVWVLSIIKDQVVSCRSNVVLVFRSVQSSLWSIVALWCWTYVQWGQRLCSVYMLRWQQSVWSVLAKIKFDKRKCDVYFICTSPDLKDSRACTVAWCSGILFHSLTSDGKNWHLCISVLQNVTMNRMMFPLVFRLVGCRYFAAGMSTKL